MAFLLNLVYVVSLVVASPWLVWAAIRKGKYREGFLSKFLGMVPEQRDDSCRRVWFHAVSVGEVNLIGTLLREIATRHPDWHCILSTTTATGYALAKKKYPAIAVFYAPMDFSWAVRRAMRRIRPSMLVLVELEVWPNLIRAAKDRGAKVAIVNGRLSERSFRGYRRIGWLARRTLQQVDLIAAATDDYAARFRALGASPNRVHVTGSLKFDGAQTDRNNEATRRLRQLAGFQDNDIVFLAGSTQAPEEQLALETFAALKDLHPRLKLILVPRHPHRFEEVAALLDRSELPWQRRSQLPTPHSELRTPNSPTPYSPPPTPSRILLIDTIGELSAWWGTATIGFVGGSLGSRGGQNMIEPAAYGVATCFGPNTRNFRDIVELLVSNQAAVVVADGKELTDFVRRCLNDPNFTSNIGRLARHLVASQLGATRRTLSLLGSEIDECHDVSDRNQAA